MHAVELILQEVLVSHFWWVQSHKLEEKCSKQSRINIFETHTQKNPKPKPPYGGLWKQYGRHKTGKDCMNRDLICTYCNLPPCYEFKDHPLKLWKRVEAF